MACVPRPPQPISPALSFSLPWPRTNSGLMIWKAVAAPILDARKDLRDLDSFIIYDLRTIYSIMQIASMDLTDFTHQPDLARAATIPARWYTDPAMLEAERRKRVRAHLAGGRPRCSGRRGPELISPARLRASRCW